MAAVFLLPRPGQLGFIGRFGDGTSHDIEVAHNRINYSGGVPPGLLGGSNLYGYDNVVNGDTSRGAWQLYAYNNIWHDVYYSGERVA